MANKAVPTGATIENKAPLIKAAAVSWDWQGFETGMAWVRLPDGVEFSDFNESPAMWKPVQEDNRVSLVRGDQVRAISFDEKWIAEGTVNYSDDSQVIFAGLKKIDLKNRATVPTADGHVIRWMRDGSSQSVGYVVIRLTDGRKVAGPFRNRAAADAAMPRRVAA